VIMHSRPDGPLRVLVIAYYFPPMGLSGVQRTLKFVKYFSEFGWQPTVLTVQPRGYLAQDDSLLTDLEGRNVRVVRTSAAGPTKLVTRKQTVNFPSEWSRKLLSRISDTIFIPDNKIGWKRKAVARAIALAKETPFDMIFATAPPFTSLLIGRAIKRKLNIPLVLDYRDPWVEYPFKFYPTPLHKLMNIQLERRALRASSHVVTTNRRVKELILRRYRFLDYSDVDIIPQGFDPEDYRKARSVPLPQHNRKAMRMTYAGVFWEDRKPDYFLRALAEVLKEQPRLRGRINAHFVGNFREENRKLVVRLGLHDSVTETGYLQHVDCIRELLTSDVLWMIVGDDVGSPGKVYEYIGAGKPILACAPDGFIKSAVLEAGGIVTAPDDVPAIKEAIVNLFNRWERHELTGPDQEVIDRYDRVILTRSLVKIFEALLVES
jgi:glycosyltransferase involved in cell wall biosynthesis